MKYRTDLIFLLDFLYIGYLSSFIFQILHFCIEWFAFFFIFDGETVKTENFRVRDGPLQKLWGVGGGGAVVNFCAAGIFFRYQIPCMSVF